MDKEEIKRAVIRLAKQLDCSPAEAFKKLQNTDPAYKKFKLSYPAGVIAKSAYSFDLEREVNTMTGFTNILNQCEENICKCVELIKKRDGLPESYTYEQAYVHALDIQDETFLKLLETHEKAYKATCQSKENGIY